MVVFEIDEIEVNAAVAKKGDELALVEIRDDENYTVDIEGPRGANTPWATNADNSSPSI